MSDGYAHARIEELPELWNGFARLVREGLGISAFGVQIMELPPRHVTESHDEATSGQEELYVALRGSGAVVIDAERRSLPLDADHVVRVSAGTARSLTAGEAGLRVLCVGGVPGGVYEPPDWTRRGE
jgi:uncharacterized cupin superfamily protein